MATELMADSSFMGRRWIWLGWIATAIFIVAASVMTYWAAETGPLHSMPLGHYIHRGDMREVREIVPGERLFVYREYCLLETGRESGILIQRWFEDGILIRLPDLVLDSENIGCPERESFPLEIPWQLKPGAATLKAKIIARVNPLKTTVQPLPDIPVVVVGERGGS